MVKKIFQAGIFATVFALASAAPYEMEERQSTPTCVNGLYMILARGTNDKQLLGKFQQVATRVAPQINDSTIVGVEYPATASSPPYPESERDGRDEMNRLLDAYVQACANDGKTAKIALMGYSQGAQLTLDTVCGTTEDRQNGQPFDPSPQLASKYNDNIVAILAAGDPSNLVNSPFLYSNNPPQKDGIFPNRNITLCKPFIPKMRSYCDNLDQFCSSSGNGSDGVHTTYMSRYRDNAIQFVLDNWDKYGN